jgi:excisionase family DNA binding protein
MDNPTATSPIRSVPSRRAAADPNILRAEQVAELLGIGRKQVFEAVGRREIPHRRIGRRILFHRTALLEWLACKSSSREQEI